VFADDGEGWKEVGHDEEVSNFFADVAEFEFAAVFAGGDVEADECAEAHAVHVGEVCEVEDKALVGGKQLGDGSVKELGGTRQQFAVTAYDGGAAVVFDLEREGRRGGGCRHGSSFGSLFYRSAWESDLCFPANARSRGEAYEVRTQL
jgi:hypothetical protein